MLCLALLGFGAAFGDAFGVLVGATAIVPYLIYLLTLGAYVARRRRILDAGDGGFRLGAAGLPIAIAALVWIFADHRSRSRRRRRSSAPTT